MKYDESSVTPRSLTQMSFCVGCGVCAGVCPKVKSAPSKALVMGDLNGKPQPVLEESLCIDCDKCVRVCPFVDHEHDEDSLGKAVFGGIPGIQRSEQCGYYLSSYIGHVSDLDSRLRSSSGGLLTWVLEKLLATDLVDAVCCVFPNARDKQDRFEFRVCHSVEELKDAAGSKYYPVEVSTILEQIRQSKGQRFAVVGLPCVLKGLRLAMNDDPGFRKRISLLLGLVCGGTKSKYFTEYLVKRYSSDYDNVDEVRFRGPDKGGLATNFQFEIEKKAGTHKEILGQVGFRKYSQLYGSGFFGAAPGHVRLSWEQFSSWGVLCPASPSTEAGLSVPPPA